MTEWDYKTAFALAYPPEPITWKQHMAEGYLRRRFDILDGIRYFHLSASMAESEVKTILSVAFINVEKQTRCGQAMFCCYDVLIRREPFRTRQPNLAFMSNPRAEQYWRDHETEPVQPAPELVVEILRHGEAVEAIADKLDDYRSVDVQECWDVRLDEQTVEILSLTPTTVTSVATYHAGQSVQSVVFPDLMVAVDDIFAE